MMQLSDTKKPVLKLVISLSNTEENIPTSYTINNLFNIYNMYSTTYSHTNTFKL